jgi:hypothetical protein
MPELPPVTIATFPLKCTETSLSVVKLLFKHLESHEDSSIRHTPTLDQAVLTEFINEGHFGHHVRKMRQVCSDRSQLLAEEANRRLSGLLDGEHAQSGMCTVAWIKTRVTEMVLTRRAEQLGLEVVPISSYVIKVRAEARVDGVDLASSGIRQIAQRRGIAARAGSVDSFHVGLQERRSLQYQIGMYLPTVFRCPGRPKMRTDPSPFKAPPIPVGNTRMLHRVLAIA